MSISRANASGIMALPLELFRQIMEHVPLWQCMQLRLCCREWDELLRDYGKEVVVAGTIPEISDTMWKYVHKIRLTSCETDPSMVLAMVRRCTNATVLDIDAAFASDICAWLSLDTDSEEEYSDHSSVTDGGNSSDESDGYNSYDSYNERDEHRERSERQHHREPNRRGATNDWRSTLGETMAAFCNAQRFRSFRFTGTHPMSAIFYVYLARFLGELRRLDLGEVMDMGNLGTVRANCPHLARLSITLRKAPSIHNLLVTLRNNVQVNGCNWPNVTRLHVDCNQVHVEDHVGVITYIAARLTNLEHFVLNCPSAYRYETMFVKNDLECSQPLANDCLRHARIDELKDVLSPASGPYLPALRIFDLRGAVHPLVLDALRHFTSLTPTSATVPARPRLQQLKITFYKNSNYSAVFDFDVAHTLLMFPRLLKLHVTGVSRIVQYDNNNVGPTTRKSRKSHPLRELRISAGAIHLHKMLDRLSQMCPNLKIKLKEEN